VREHHLSYATASKEKGHFMAGGAYSDISGGFILFKAHNEDTVKRFIHSDPYFTSGLITNYKIKEWNIAIGSEMFFPKKKQLICLLGPNQYKWDIIIVPKV